MRTRALALGISPQPFEGPWVNVSDGGTWEIRPTNPLSDTVRIETLTTEGVQTKWDWSNPIISGCLKARVVIDAPHEGPHIFINAVEI